MKVLVDASVLVRLRELSSPAHSACWNAVLRLRERATLLYLCTQSIVEFWSVRTRPKEHNGLGQTIHQTLQDREDFLTVFQLLPEPDDILQRWLTLVRQYEVRGKQVHDARMVALAWSCNVEQILTLNPSDFTRFREIMVLTPDSA